MIEKRFNKIIIFLLIVLVIILVILVADLKGEVKAIKEDIVFQQQHLDAVDQWLIDITKQLEKVEEEKIVLTSLGEYKLTAYCPCESCCGIYANGITSIGNIARENHTIAVDPKVIPYGSKVYINGNIYVAEDCGGAIKGNRIDVFFNDHESASDFGVQYCEVFLVVEE